MQDRRAFLCTAAGSLLIAPLAVLAQQTTKVARIGYLRRTSREPADIEALRLGLRELGYVEGQNLVIDERYANGDAARLPDLARELIQLKVQVLVVDGGATVRAVREVVGATPLVFTLVERSRCYGGCAQPRPSRRHHDRADDFQCGTPGEAASALA